jgi:hypothetical protein
MSSWWSFALPTWYGSRVGASEIAGSFRRADCGHWELDLVIGGTSTDDSIVMAAKKFKTYNDCAAQRSAIAPPGVTSRPRPVSVRHPRDYKLCDHGTPQTYADQRQPLRCRRRCCQDRPTKWFPVDVIHYQLAV